MPQMIPVINELKTDEKDQNDIEDDEALTNTVNNSITNDSPTQQNQDITSSKPSTATTQSITTTTEKKIVSFASPNNNRSVKFLVPPTQPRLKLPTTFPAADSPQRVGFDKRSIGGAGVRGSTGKGLQPPAAAGTVSSSALQRRQKVALKPGHSAMDWETKKHKTDQRQIDPSSFPLRVTKAELKKHQSVDDCWICLGKKVYNISGYLSYHPGGVDILVRSSGKDGTSMFNKYHRWVNYERILDACFVGFMT
ncbi:unnamed protein product [Ambrosiozyma monospora]|uniref:Unnamed protein product n=1 Tax=Ambrosiozyma monospora TaxID=43982 RepID=A0ACB5SV00_AMBMO|nr:unnamed protein product [Ambrosiozyma monospora]